jgi:acetolactate synthase-1/2/3 large subunit
MEMIEVKKPVLFDVRVDPKENCYPMIPSGKAHNDLILSDAQEEATQVSDEGKMLV